MKLQGKSGSAEKNRRKYFAQSIYCNESIMNIENYGKALNDDFKGWHIHHRLETHNSDGKKRLVALEAEELIAKISATTKISCKDLHKECREAYKKSGRKDWNTFQKEYYKENR